MKVLVLGGTGMAGHTISLYFSEKGYNVTAQSRTPFEHCKNIVCDVTDFEFLEKIVRDGNYDVVINAIGILNNIAEENKSLAVVLNSYLPHFLSDITKDMRTRVIHLSTDCVFGKQVVTSRLP